MRFRLTGTTVGLALGITVAVSSVLAGGAYLYSTHHFESLLDTARQTSVAQGDLIRVALEHQMIENDRTLIAKMIQSFGSQPSIERVVLLDRTGHVKYSSVPENQTGDLQIGSPTCQACHRLPPSQRGSSRVLETGGGTVLRTVVPIPNREACHRCHDPALRMNGILILDRNVGDVRASINRDLGWMVGGTGLATLLLVGAIAGVFRFVVLRRLQRFESTARQIAAGNLDRRVPDEGSDTISWLAREFNAMADSVTGLVGEVRNQRERLETVINSIDDGIVVLDTARIVIAANDAFLGRTAGGARRCSGPAVRTRPRRRATSGSARPRAAWRPANGRSACANARPQTAACGGRKSTHRPSRTPTAGSRTSWKCGAISPIAVRPRPPSPSRTSWRRSACSPRASPTS